MTETVIWTIVFFGGDLAAVVGLMTLAIRKDKQKARAATTP